LRLFTPLGTQVALARWSAGDVRLLSSEGEARFATLEDLSRQVLGEALPLAALGDWLRGRPWPEVPAEPLPGGSFRQLGWEIVLSRRDDGHIRFTRAAPPQVTVRVVLDPAERAP
jgi:outer membrane lipoprotein LolB